MSFSESRLRRLGLGKLALALWHRPIGRARDSWRSGGPIAEWQTELRRRDMESAAAQLPPVPGPSADTPFCVHLLSGHRFWYQTAFCLHSLARAAGEPVRAEIYDDGTLTGNAAEHLRRLGPAVRIHPQSSIIVRLNEFLPSSRFPVLRERWLNYPNIRKLIDTHVGSRGWKLVLDSDLLFFRRPEMLLAWLRAPDRPLHAVDCKESYGYSRPLLEKLVGAPIPSLVNVGVCGLRSDMIDWDELEAWTAELQARERTSYYLEQALIAMLAARQCCAIAPAADYITMPGEQECLAPTVVMHHYVAESKRWYFRYGWRHTLK